MIAIRKLDKKTMAKTALLLAVMMLPTLAFAGDAGDGEFDQVWDTLVTWIEGTLGRIIAVSIILVGIIAGVARQSLIAFAIGIAGGMGLYNSPTIIEAIMTATLPII